MDFLEGRFGASTWAGVVDGLWSTAANWNENETPTTGDALVFPFGAGNKTSTNNLAADTAFSAITIGDADYILSGNAITLTGGISATHASGLSQLALPIEVASTTSVSVSNADATLNLGGVISGAGGLTKEGAGTLVLGASNTYNGATQVNGGALVLQNGQVSGPVILSAGTRLGGAGQVETLTSTGGTVQAGDATTPGLLSVTGALTLDTNSTFSVLLNGTTAGTEYSQVQAGVVALGDASLNLSVDFQPVGTPTFMIVNNTGSSPVSGTFEGLADGDTLTASGETFRIDYDGGDGNDVVLTRLMSSATAVTAAPASPVFGESVTLTATVLAGETTAIDPTGSVEFFVGGTSLGTVALSNGTATLPTSTLVVGTNQVTAAYLGDTNFAESTSSQLSVDVTQAQTTTTLTVDPTTSVVGQSVTLTATVAVVSPGGGTPTGTVQFLADGNAIGTADLSGGTAVFQTTDLLLGAHAITAQYLGSTGYVTSTSADEGATVNQASTTTTVNATPNPAAEGETVTLTATVAAVSPGGGTPTGTVEFFNGATSLGTAPLVGGVATFDTSSLPLASNSITAQFPGDDNYIGSTSSALIVDVLLGSTTALVIVPTSSTYGESVTLTATVAGSTSPDTPTGQVEFFAGSTSLGTADLANGVAVLSTAALPGGSPNVTARYLGDTDFAPSTSPGVTVTVAQASTTTTLSVVPSATTFGESVTLTATVNGSGPESPTGTVRFYTGSTLLATIELTNGTATYSTGGLPIGVNDITAEYEGDTNYTASTSDAQTVTVSKATTSVAVTAAPTSPVYGQSVTLTATVSVAAPGSGTPTGTVTFFAGATELGEATLANGIAVFNTSTLAVGANSITARYDGSDSYETSTSDVTTVTVAQATTTTTLTAAPNPSQAGAAVTLTATVAVSSPGAGTLTGTVTFFAGAVELGTATINNGTATLSTSAIPVGTTSLSARYDGDGSFQTSTSAAVSQVVNQVTTTTTLTVSDETPSASSPVTLTAVVAAATGSSVVPTGTVQFLSGTTVLGTATLSGGTATLTLDSLPVGVSSLTAKFLGDENAQASTSAAVDVTVGTANERYVNQLYLRLLGRAAEPEGLDFWAGRLDDGASRESVVSAIQNTRASREFQVQQAYGFYLGREATSGEVSRTLAAAIANGTNIEGIILSSREYYQNVGGGTLLGYLDALSQDIFGQAMFDPAVEYDLGAQITKGVPLVDVVREILTSQPGKVALVSTSIGTILDRAPKPAEAETYASELNQNVLLRQVQVQLYATNEFYENAIAEAPVDTTTATLLAVTARKARVR